MSKRTVRHQHRTDLNDQAKERRKRAMELDARVDELKQKAENQT